MFLIEATASWFLIVGLVLVVGMVANLSLGRRLELASGYVIAIYCWHMIFCLAYAAFVLEDGGDALFYFAADEFESRSLEPGTSAVLLLTGLFSKLMGMPFLAVSILFASVGCLGVLGIAATLREITWSVSSTTRFLLSLIVFLPSLHFWSAGIGKDSLALCAVGLVIYGLVGRRSSSLLVWIGACLLIIVRPHIGAVFVVAYFAGRSLASNTSMTYRSLAVVGSVAAVALAFPIVAGLVGLGSSGAGVGSADIAEFIARRQSYNLEGGGGVDISSMSLPNQLFTYMFRPLPFEVNSIFSFFASIDNVIVFLILVFGFYSTIKSRAAFRLSSSHVLWLYSLGSWLALAITTANLGIAVRQKWMFLPCLLCLAFSFSARQPSHGKRRAVGRRNFAI